MTLKLTALTLAALLQVVLFILVSVRANTELSPGKTTSRRDRFPIVRSRTRTA